MALRTPTKDAEDIKQRFGCALSQLADPQEMVDVPGVGDRSSRQLSRKTLAEVHSKPVSRNSIRWYRRNCAAAAMKNCCPRVWC